MNVQIIKNSGKPEWAVLPYQTYLKLVEKAEMLEDIRDYDQAKADLENGREELIPAELIFAIQDGKNPIKAWREYRSLSQQELADMADISVPYLSQLETGRRKGSLEVLTEIAKALKVSLDNLTPAD